MANNLKPKEVKELIVWGMEHLKELNIPEKLAVNVIRYSLKGATYKEIFEGDKEAKKQFKVDMIKLLENLEDNRGGNTLKKFSNEPQKYQQFVLDLITQEIRKAKKTAKNKTASYKVASPELRQDITFKTGAIREDKTGKGRFDFGDIEVQSGWQKEYELQRNSFEIPKMLGLAIQSGKGVSIDLLNKVAVKFINTAYKGEFSTAMLELAQYMEKCAERYPANNWKKGIPNNSFYNSALRHYYKYMRGDDSENHKSAFLWNCQGLVYNAKMLKKDKVKGGINVRPSHNSK